MAGRLLPRFLSITHPRHKTPYVVLLAGSAVALAIMFGLWFGMGAEKGGIAIQGVLLNRAVAGATLSYLLQAVSFIVLRMRRPGLARPYRSSPARSSPWSSPPSRLPSRSSTRCSPRA